MSNKKLIIAGYGNIGKLEYQAYSKKFEVDIYDKFKPEYQKLKNTKYDFCIICVNTPLTKFKTLDISAVEDVIKTVKAEIYLCRSTLPVGTTENLMKKYNVRLVMYPEFYGTTQHANNFEFNFSILGGNKEDTCACQQMLQKLFDARHTFRLVEPKVAELAKLAENTYLLSKVAIFAEFWDICQKNNICYEDFRECVTLDPRIGKPHTFIDDEYPVADSHCLNKDVPALAYQFNSELFKDILKSNDLKKSRFSK